MWQLQRGGRGEVSAKRETLPHSVVYSSHSDSELHPCLWSSLLNRVRVEKYSEEKVARHRQSSERTTTRDRLAGAMLRYMCDARDRKLQPLDQNAKTRPLFACWANKKAPAGEGGQTTFPDILYAALQGPARQNVFRFTFQMKTDAQHLYS